MHSQVHSFCSMLIHGNTFHSCGTPSLLESTSSLSVVDWWRHTPSDTRTPTHGHGDTLLLFLSHRRHTPSIHCCFLYSRHTTLRSDPRTLPGSWGTFCVLFAVDTRLHRCSHGDSRQLIRPTDPSRLTGNCCCCLESHSTSLPDTQGILLLLGDHTQRVFGDTQPEFFLYFICIGDSRLSC